MKRITLNSSLNEERHMPVTFRSLCTDYEQESLKWPKGYMHFYKLQFITEGEGIFRCNGHEYPLKQGCGFFVAKEESFELVNVKGLKAAIFSAVGALPAELMRICNCESHIFYEKVDLKKYIGMLNDIEHEYYSTGKKAKLSSLTYELLAEFFFGENEQQSSIAEEVLMYIKRNFTKKLSLEDISKQIGVSVSKICHDFKVKYGCSIFTKIKDLRLNYAKELLLSNSNWHIREVALACGFDDFSYFCRAYKERFNKTPKNSVKY